MINGTRVGNFPIDRPGAKVMVTFQSELGQSWRRRWSPDNGDRQDPRRPLDDRSGNGTVIVDAVVQQLGAARMEVLDAPPGVGAAIRRAKHLLQTPLAAP